MNLFPNTKTELKAAQEQIATFEANEAALNSQLDELKTANETAVNQLDELKKIHATELEAAQNKIAKLEEANANIPQMIEQAAAKAVAQFVASRGGEMEKLDSPENGGGRETEKTKEELVELYNTNPAAYFKYMGLN